MSAVTLEAALRRDRTVVVAGLIALVIVSWLYLWHEAVTMSPTTMRAGMAMAMPGTTTWTSSELVGLTVMWAIMMVGMMLPSAAPILLVFTTIQRARHTSEASVPRTALFLLGYLVIWSVFSVLAAVAQWALHGLALLSPMMVATSPLLGGSVLVAAGAFQWTRLKHACLSTCRSPVGFLMGEWRDGPRGALVMGLRHGAFCLGCCWALMAVLFVAGVMNLLWVAAIAAFVLIEKAARSGDIIARAGGVLLVVAGVVVAAAVGS